MIAANRQFSDTSRARGRFADVDAFAEAVEAFWRSQEVSVVQDGGDSVLRMAGHRDIRSPHRHRSRPFQRRKQQDVYEEALTVLLTFLLSRFEIRHFLDIGAGIGYFAEVASSFENDPPKSYAFDMLPARRPDLERLAERSGGLVEVFFAGMSDAHYGEQEIWYSVTKMYQEKPPEDFYRDSIWRRIKFWLRGRADRDRLVRHVLDITSIDHFGQSRQIVPDLLKIDVDGYEAKVVPGGEATFREHRPLIVLELHKSRFLKPFDTTRRAIVRPLFEMGYRGFLITNHHHRASARCVPIGIDDPRIMREATDLLLFV